MEMIPAMDSRTANELLGFGRTRGEVLPYLEAQAGDHLDSRRETGYTWPL